MKTIFIAISTIIFLTGCTKTIDVQLRSVPPQIVIQGNITNAGGPYYITINQTVPFDAQNTYPPISNAQVIVLDSNDNVLDKFTETTPGNYISHNLIGQVGHTYKLSVIIDGKEYTASSTMPKHVAMTFLSFSRQKIFNETRNLPQVNFQDPPDVTNYYVFTVLVNNVPYKAFYAMDDRLSDGKFIRKELYMDSAYIQARDNVTVIMANVDKNIYNYFYVLQSNSGNSTVTPSNPPSNISNNALGYFGAESVDIKSEVF
ncbi:protein of unknown function [Chitinophaga sp. CF118]|uniref:DUF4249 domain-containing protein n=1 Tax=Chitinophaga sp. CF118 TaxID=1884367 RepID=UPI0008F08DC2|nr:DUF4249 domain-containing protein [Chitinophaga sp. CF118]SFE60335.1 protein of unknown function [Chitinophaga sp. CF118]